MPWILMPPRAATTNASTAVEIASPRNVRSQSCSAVNVNSLAAVIRRTAPIRARAATRPAVPRQKKVQPPGMRLKVLKTKRKTRARAVIGPSPYKEYLWTKQELGSRKSLSPRCQSGCAKDNNRYNVLSVEEIKESKDSADNKIISNSILLSEGSPSGLARDIKPGLNSSIHMFLHLQ